MKISRANASTIAIIAGSRSSSAFNLNSPLIDVPPSILGKSTIPYAQRPAPFLSALVHLPCSNSRRFTSLHMSQSHHDPEDSSQTPWGEHEMVGTSRRAALRQCASIFASTAFASSYRQEAAHAAEFSEGLVEPEEDLTPSIDPNAPPQFFDETVITPTRPQEVVQQQQQEGPESNDPSTPDSSVSATVASNPQPPAQVTLENSQVVTIPTKQVPMEVPVAYPSQFNQASPAPTVASSSITTPAKSKNEKKRRTKAESRKNALMAEVGITVAGLGAIAAAVSGRGTPNTDALISNCKVVMIENEPYGLDNGRRYYNGVDITTNDPIPASDVRQYCEAGTVNTDCAETITDFLGNVQSNSKNGLESPSMEQQEVATAVLSYLGSLSSDPTHTDNAAMPSHNGGDVYSSTGHTAVAFSSYLNGISNGEIDAPASPQLVADYLSSLNQVESRMNTLESSVNRIPDEITGRLQEWQEGQDERLAKEFNKIEEYLMKIEDLDNGGDVPSVDLNGAVNAGYDSSYSW
eukprot:CAMPEP_0172314824 /NCGR_PEP_ID=MMETSP1058-20130122/23354_1 /TAXON_ID=83371 /ORGANISM="Detonula confervacea, Strain CCMP 353" /LENGTH=520 /DNA_ID=CAMNT_0013028771 /DNA_START=76 /DNA_END=1638 /DNA_ORIENTATION=-